MRRLVIGLWKEARDQRAILLALLVALPVLVFAAAWAFGDQLPRHQFSVCTLFVVPTALALFLIAVASELFGSERRRGTLEFARRLPRGLTSALASKLAAYVAGSLLFAAWGWCVAYVACALFGPGESCGELLRLTWDSPDRVVAGCCLLLVASGVWVLLVSTWIPQGGAAVLGAALLLGLLALPVVLALKGSPWLVNQLKPQQVGDLTAPFVVFTVVPLLALALSFLRGNRFLSSAWSPAWRGLTLIAVVATGGFAMGASALERALTIDAHDPGFQIASGCVGAGGRFAYLNVGRSDMSMRGHNGLPTTPPQPWIVDLSTGVGRRVGEFDEGWYVSPEAPHAPQPIVRLFAGAGDAVGWYDGATATLRKTLPFVVRTPEIHAWEREALAALSWHRDAQGRALWFEGDELIHAGDPLPKDLRYRGHGTGWESPIPGGWVRYGWKQGTSRPEHVTIEAATGQVRPVPTDLRGQPTFLSPRVLLLNPAQHGLARYQGTLAVYDLDVPDAAAREVRAPPGVEWMSTSSEDLVGTGAEAASPLLLMTGEQPEQRRLMRWSPLSDEMREITCAGTPLIGYSWNELARVPGGLSVVRLQRYPLTNDGSKPYEFQHLLLRASRDEATLLGVLGHSLDVLTIFRDGAVIGIEGGQRIVRYGPEVGARTVLFPR